MKLNIKITTNAGDQATYTAQPPEWRKWELETGQKISKDPSLGISDLMFLAYHAMKRENPNKAALSLDNWCATVADIEIEETAVNPTQAVASDD
jgi:hypothetical protein